MTLVRRAAPPLWASSSRSRQAMDRLFEDTFVRPRSWTGIEPDKATATFDHGVLKVEIPKAAAVKPHQIRITPSTTATSSNGPNCSNGKKDLAAGETTIETSRAAAAGAGA